LHRNRAARSCLASDRFDELPRVTTSRPPIESAQTTPQEGSAVTASAVSVDRASIVSALRRAGHVPSADHDGACQVPVNELVVEPDGTLRACEHACTRLAAATGDWLDAWRGSELQRLRVQLESRRIPASPCGTCAAWVDGGLLEQAPPFREHGALPRRDAGDSPATLVLRLPDAADLDATALARLRELLPRLGTLRVVSRTPLGERADERWLAALRELPSPPALEVRLRGGTMHGVAAALRGLRVTSIEATVVRGDRALLSMLRDTAQQLGAIATARFVLDRTHWFEFEEVALAAVAAAVPFAFTLIDDDGRVPLAEVAAEDLDLVKSLVVTAWSRLDGRARPAAIPEHLFFRTCDELRRLLLRRLDREPGGEGAPAHREPLQMPPFDHVWLTDVSRVSWWANALLSVTDRTALRSWVTGLARNENAVDRLLDSALLRLLAQRVADAVRDDELLELLATVYRPVDRRPGLLAADAALRSAVGAAAGDSATRLGLVPMPPRVPPFAIGTAVRAEPDAEPDVTVLVPAYRHGRFVQDSIRSVLAQTHSRFRLLVVDDASPDDTAARVGEVEDPRLELRVNATNMGLGDSVLSALATIDTPYVALLNSDDLFHPDRLAECVRALEEDRRAQVVATGLVLIDRDGGQLTPANSSLVLDGRQVSDWVHWFERAVPAATVPVERLLGELLERNFLATSSNLVVRTAWLREHAAVLQGLEYCLDWQLFLDAAFERALVYLPRPTVAYRLHPSNTVWFREGRRWAFYLETNRVLATTLRRVAASVPDAATRVLTVLRLLGDHVAVNREADGIALFVNGLAGDVEAATVADDSPAVQAELQRLNVRAARSLALRDDAENREEAASQSESRARLLAALAVELLPVELSRSRGLQAYADDVESRLVAAIAAHGFLEQEKQGLQRLSVDLDARLQQSGDELARTRAHVDALDERHRALSADLVSLRQAVEQLREQSTLLAAVRSLLEQDVAAARHERDVARRDAEAARGQTDAVRGDLAAAAAEVGRQRDAAADAAAREQALQADLRLVTSERAKLVEQLALRERSREYRIGNFIWNGLALSTISRRVKKWHNRLVDGKQRLGLWLGRRFGRHRAEGVAIVASCWHWPIYSHTFVYQEMIGLTHMGLDVRMFHWAENDTAQLQPAFAYLASHRTQIKCVWENHFADKRHYDVAKPGRLRALLDRIAPLVGRTADDLEQDAHVLQACTFARMAELAGARYLHTYFFYDQTFMAMIAAWLLEIPRGISCYADHMLNDYPFKLVGLQIELAQVVVATSARIKQELSQLSGGRFDERIVVKPNGVDGTRFPLVARGVRSPDEPFEIVSVSRIEPKKGLEYLVEAVALLKRNGRRVRAHVVGAHDPHSAGSLEYDERLRALIRDRGLTEDVVLHGMKLQEEILPLLQRSRAFVAPYVELHTGDKDGIPTAMLEAMAAQLPIVTTTAGSIAEVVDDGVEALVVAQRDAEAFASALERLIGDVHLEQRLGRAARARFERQFDVRVTERPFHQRVAEHLKARR
jgi:glycosyltransferase involved in cell wall biosynthesis